MIRPSWRRSRSAATRSRASSAIWRLEGDDALLQVGPLLGEVAGRAGAAARRRSAAGPRYSACSRRACCARLSSICRSSSSWRMRATTCPFSMTSPTATSSSSTWPGARRPPARRRRPGAAGSPRPAPRWGSSRRRPRRATRRGARPSAPRASQPRRVGDLQELVELLRRGEPLERPPCGRVMARLLEVGGWSGRPPRSSPTRRRRRSGCRSRSAARRGRAPARAAPRPGCAGRRSGGRAGEITSISVERAGPQLLLLVLDRPLEQADRGDRPLEMLGRPRHRVERDRHVGADLPWRSARPRARSAGRRPRTGSARPGLAVRVGQEKLKPSCPETPGHVAEERREEVAGAAALDQAGVAGGEAPGRARGRRAFRRRARRISDAARRSRAAARSARSARARGRTPRPARAAPPRRRARGRTP